jgi:hypothetical protein
MTLDEDDRPFIIPLTKRDGAAVTYLMENLSN